MKKKKKFNPLIARVKLDVEQAVLACCKVCCRRGTGCHGCTTGCYHGSGNQSSCAS